MAGGFGPARVSIWLPLFRARGSGWNQRPRELDWDLSVRVGACVLLCDSERMSALDLKYGRVLFYVCIVLCV